MLGREGGKIWEVTISGHLLNHPSLTITFVQMLGKDLISLLIFFSYNLNYYKIKNAKIADDNLGCYNLFEKFGLKKSSIFACFKITLLG